MLTCDLSSPNERARRGRIVAGTRKNNLDLAKKAQIESQIAARNKANKRKEMTARRAEKRKRSEEDNGTAEEEPETKKKKKEGRIIDFTERDFEHVKRLFNTVIVYFGNVNLLGLVCGYDMMFCPSLVYPIFVGPQETKKQSVYSRKFILGVGKSSNVFTGIKQAFTELYPEHPADRVYDWKLMKWNRKSYKAVTVNVAVDPSVLSQHIFSSKSFGGTKHLPAVKVTDEMASARKMECAIEVSKYIQEFVPDSVKNELPKDYCTLSFADIRSNLEEAERKEAKAKEAEEKVESEVIDSDVITQAFEKIERERQQAEDSEIEDSDSSYD